MKLQIQMQREQMQLQKQKEVELQQIQKEIEIEKIRAENRNKVNEARVGKGAQGNESLERKVISMPNFVEGEEENFFIQFEKKKKKMQI